MRRKGAMLAGLVLAFSGRPVWSAIALAGGFMAKLIPLVLLPTALKSDGRWRWRLAAAGAFVLFVGYFAAPFLATGRHWLVHSVESSVRRAPWETVWALLDKRHEFGYVGPAPSDYPDFYARYKVHGGVQATLASAPPGLFGEGPRGHVQRLRVASRFARDLSFIDSQPRMEWVWPVYALGGLVVGGGYLLTFARLPAELPQRRRLVFAAFSLVVFFFYSKGWSPQFVLYLIPLLLVAFTPGEGAVWCLLLSATAFLETPVWTHHLFGRPDHVLAAPLVLVAAVLGRTFLFVLITLRLYRRLWRD